VNQKVNAIIKLRVITVQCFETKLNQQFARKEEECCPKKVLLHHNNARPHTAATTVETVQQLGFEVLQHPPYSSDLTPSDCHIFGPLKEVLRGCRFTSESIRKASSPQEYRN
jgi:histone-lysine N-methyltransferase SETMAR